ncbi:MAG: hypothetical protein N3A38_12590 [Planctomycetota bacterium]|nr:hypothetical protein [Planctomycetota bacterium]
MEKRRLEMKKAEESAVPGGNALKWRGLLIHMTHYDPAWIETKHQEKKWDKATGLAVVDAMAGAGMNMLIVDVEDAVIYRTLPDIRRKYSVPMSELVEMAGRAKEHGIELVPKMNFSLSPRHRHSAWFEPTQALPPSKEFWRRGLAALDEVVEAVRPGMVHVGMDEDDTRSPQEYLRDLLRLRRELKRRGLRMVMWADVGHRWQAQERWKQIPAIKELPRDVILMPWRYDAVPEDWARRLVKWGFEVIGASGCWVSGRRRPKDKDPLENTRLWVAAIRKARGAGVVVTNWTKCSRENRAALLKTVKLCGPILAFPEA